eukprot:scaffold119947_cov18-Tisochrysis_lutea.AAC.2
MLAVIAAWQLRRLHDWAVLMVHACKQVQQIVARVPRHCQGFCVVSAVLAAAGGHAGLANSCTKQWP